MRYIPSRRSFIRSTFGGLSIPFAAQAFHSSEKMDVMNNGVFDIYPLQDAYLSAIRQELERKWPQNRTVNLVFHGHSVPAGYFKTPVVNTLESYPFLVLKGLKERYPHAVVNSIVTSIGGEDARQGAARFTNEVLCHRPDVLFIDYALNDQRIGLEASLEAWTHMIVSAIQRNVKVILLTATPDQRVDILDKGTLLQRLCDQIGGLARTHSVGIVDSYKLFQHISTSGGKISDYMSQVNHPNAMGHQRVADAILSYF
jgi:acyl-CoA thioesterase-1